MALPRKLSPPLIVAFVADLMFAARIESVAERLGYHVNWIGSIQAIDPQASPSGQFERTFQLAEHLSGSGALLLEQLTSWRPALIILDLNNDQIPWHEWLPLIKSAPATRRLPVIGFGSHVDTATLQAARSSGADAVMARSRFVAELPDLIQKYARQTDYAALEETCQVPLSELAIKGIKLFNQGRYFEAHEALEEAWNEDQSPGRELYRAILQIAVAYLQIERGNYDGAMKMFLRVRQWIDPLPDFCRGVDVERLRQDVRLVRQQLITLGRKQIGEFDHALFKPVHYHAQR